MGMVGAMAKPKAYEPAEGQRWQILCRDGREWEHCDDAVDQTERRYLLNEYRLAYGAGWQFMTIRLPRKFWPVRELPS